MKRNYRFEDYVEKANAAPTKEALFKVYSDTVAQHGLDRALLCLATDHKDIGESQGIGVIHNYPEDWMKYYFQHRLDQIDPVMIYGLDKVGSYTWKEIPQRMKLSKNQSACLLMGQEAGLHNGVCTPLRGPNNALAGLSLASTEKIDGFDGRIDLITAYSNHFYIALRRLGEKKQNKETKNYALSEKEREILTWASMGKTDTEIGMIMGLSNHTIDWHFRNVFKKLEANSRTLAIVKAMTYGLITP